MFTYLDEDNQNFLNTDIKEENKESDITEDGNVICRICKKEYNIISASHLKKSHGITMEQYKMRFPNATLVGEKARIRKKYNGNKLFDNEEIETKEDEFKEFYEKHDEPEIESLDIKKEIEEIDTDEVIDEKRIIKEFIEEKTKDFNVLEYKSMNENIKIEYDPIKKMKFRILETLKKYFSNIKMDYLIEEKSMIGNRLLYVHITDFCDPVLKVDVEFPNTFWHNQDIIEDPNRDTKLERDGWCVIRIPGNAPSNIKIKKYIDKSF